MFKYFKFYVGLSISQCALSKHLIEAVQNAKTMYVSDSCISLFKDFEKVAQNSRAFANIYRLTGKDYNDFGKFNNCVDNP